MASASNDDSGAVAPRDIMAREMERLREEFARQMSDMKSNLSHRMEEIGAAVGNGSGAKETVSTYVELFDKYQLGSAKLEEMDREMAPFFPRQQFASVAAGDFRPFAPPAFDDLALRDVNRAIFNVLCAVHFQQEVTRVAFASLARKLREEGDEGAVQMVDLITSRLGGLWGATCREGVGRAISLLQFIGQDKMWYAADRASLEKGYFNGATVSEHNSFVRDEAEARREALEKKVKKQFLAAAGVPDKVAKHYVATPSPPPQRKFEAGKGQGKGPATPARTPPAVATTPTVSAGPAGPAKA